MAYDRDFDQATDSAQYGLVPTAAKAPEPSALVARLRADAVNLDDQLRRTLRAEYILTTHPEFELFLELLTLIRVPMRIAPIQAAVALVKQ